MMLDSPAAFNNVAVGFAYMGIDYLDFLDLMGYLPPTFEYDLPGLISFAQLGLSQAMTLCAPDFEKELKATTGWVNGKLSSHKISW